MTCTALVRPLSAVTWELRRAWASGRRVALSLEHCDMDRLEGIVVHVSGTGVIARVAGRVVPTERILAVHWPSVLGDGSLKPDGRGRRVQQLAGQEALSL